MADDLIKSDGNTLMRILHNGKDIDIPKPFERDIFLFDTYVAGTSYINDMEEISNRIKIDDRLNFYREPDNVHDRKAIKVTLSNGTKIGYIPRTDNAVFARLMDAGKLLFGKVSSIEQNAGYVRIEMRIYLHE